MRRVFATALIAATAFARAPSTWSHIGPAVVHNALALHHGALYVTHPMSASVMTPDRGMLLATIRTPSPETVFSGQMSFKSDDDDSFVIPCGTAHTAALAMYDASSKLVWNTTFSEHAAAFPPLKGVDCRLRSFSFVGGNVVGVCHRAYAGPGLENATLFALSASTGEVQWATAIGQPPVTETAPIVDVATGTVASVVGSSTGANTLTIHAFNASTGAIVWVAKPHELLDPFTPLSVCDGVLFAFGSDMTVGLAVSTGKPVWSPLSASLVVTTTPRCVPATAAMASPEPTIVFVNSIAQPNHVTRIGVRSGSLLFSAPVGAINSTVDYGRQNVAVDVKNDRVFVLLGAPNPSRAGHRYDSLAVATVQLSTGRALSLTTSVENVLFAHVTAGIAALPSTNATKLFFAANTALFQGTVYCRSFP